MENNLHINKKFDSQKRPEKDPFWQKNGGSALFKNHFVSCFRVTRLLKEYDQIALNRT